MRIGLISERVFGGRKMLFDRGYALEKFEICDGMAEVFAVTIPFSEERLEKTSPRRISKSVDGALLRLKDEGVDAVVFSVALKKLLKPKSAERPCGKEMLCLLAPDCIRGFAKKCGLELHRACVGISGDETGKICEYLTEALAPYVRTIRLCCENTATAKRLCDKAFDDTGMLMSVCDDKFDSGRDDVFIDTRRGTVRIGRDLTLDGAEFDMDLKGYRADTSDVAACLLDIGILKKVKAYTSDKKKLTL